MALFFWRDPGPDPEAVAWGVEAEFELRDGDRQLTVFRNHEHGEVFVASLTQQDPLQ